MAPDQYVQIMKILVFLVFLYFTIRGVYDWRRTGLLYLLSAGAMAAATFWSLISRNIFTDWARFYNDSATALIQVAAVLSFIFIQIRFHNLNKKIAALSDGELIDQFIKGAESHVHFAESEDRNGIAKGTAAVEEMKLAYFEMKRREPDLRSLHSLLNHNSHAVRMWIARRLLDKYESECLVILDELAKGNNYVSTKSREIARAWRQGSLKM